MKKSNRAVPVSILSAVCMLIFILDSQTGIHGASEGIELCLRTVIPSLFPLMILSGIMTGSLYGRSVPFFRPIQKLCGIPSGSEGILLSGLLGGYPIGAKCVSQAYKENILYEHEASRMLGFCNNAGPAFIFGICGELFSSKLVCWVLWGIHILSAIMVGTILPGKVTRSINTQKSDKTDIMAAVATGLKTMAAVCGWVIIFRVLLSFFAKWFLWLIPHSGYVLLSGLLELTNGCCLLQKIANEHVRFILCSVMLSFGGLCVMMQTFSVTAGLGGGMYMTGKLLQTAISLLLSVLTSQILFVGQTSNLGFMWILLAILLLPCVLYFKKRVAFSQQIVYNDRRNVIKR